PWGRTYGSRSALLASAERSRSMSCSRSTAVRPWSVGMPRQPRVPRVSLLSQASTLPPRVTPSVAAIIREAVVLCAPPLRLTTAMFRGPSSGRRMRSRRSVSRRSRLFGRGEITPPVSRVMRPGRPRVALTFSGFAVEDCRSWRVGREGSFSGSVRAGSGRLRTGASCACAAEGAGEAEAADDAEVADHTDAAEEAGGAEPADAAEAGAGADEAAGAGAAGGPRPPPGGGPRTGPTHGPVGPTPAQPSQQRGRTRPRGRSRPMEQARPTTPRQPRRPIPPTGPTARRGPRARSPRTGRRR